MRRRFRSRTFVLRKKYLKFVPLTVLFAFVLKGGLPSFKVNPEDVFGRAVLCMADKNREEIPAYMRILRDGNIAFAFRPEDPEPERTVKVEPEPETEVQAEETVAVQEKFLSIPSTGIEMRNHTAFAPDTAALEADECGFLPVEQNSDKPQVLIFHTHTTESFYGCDRTDDETKNVVATGSVIAEILNSRGVNTIHCKTVHDYDYNGSYGKSYATVETYLAENPSIKVVLDVHRDGITYEDGSGLRVISDINGKTAGQVMLVLGTDEGGLYHPGWESNLSFALKIQRRMNEKYPGLARPLNLRSERFNQNLSPGMMIVEIGGNGNALSEAQYGAELFAEVLLDVISQQK